MTSYTTNLLIAQPTPLDPTTNNTWGTTLNTDWSLVDSAVSGILSLSVAGSSNVVLTSNQGATDQARNQHFIFTGILTGNIHVLWPNGLDRMFSVTNSTTGAFTLTCSVNNGGGSPAGTGVAIGQGSTVMLLSDGTDVQTRAMPAGFFTFTGPTTTTKTFTLPNASDTIACLGQSNTFTKQQGFAQATLSDGATISWDASVAQSAAVTLGGNRTLANPTNAIGGFTYILKVIQDGTGSRTLSYGANYKWPNGTAPVLSTTAGAYDILGFYYDGTYMNGTFAKNFG